MSRFLRKSLADLAPYVPGEQPREGCLIKLNTNESPFPPAPGVLEAYNRAEAEGLRLYPDPGAVKLEEAIAARYGLERNQVIAGNGSDEILAFCFQAFGERVCYPDITYGMYAVLATLYGADAREVPLAKDFRVAPCDYHGVGRTVFLANPNAPTGLYLSLGQIESILQQNQDALIVIDEAYIDFGGESAVRLLPRYENLLVVQTFSKSRSLAGARIGFALGSTALIDDLRRVKNAFNPYSLNRLSILAGAAAMADEAHFAACVGAIVETRDWTADQMRSRGFVVTDSMANFLFVSHPALAGRRYAQGLRDRGVLVRHFALPRIDDYVRITVGTREQMAALLGATDILLEEAQ